MAMDQLLKMATEQERKLAETVLRDLINRRADKVTGEIAWRAVMNEGCVRRTWIESKVEAK